MKKKTGNLFSKLLVTLPALFLIQLNVLAQNASRAKVNTSDLNIWIRQNWLWLTVACILLIFAFTPGKKRKDSTAMIREEDTFTAKPGTLENEI